MSILIERYNPTVYDSLKDVEDVDKQVTGDQIRAGDIILTSKPIEPTPSTLKADLAVFDNSNMLITKIIGKNAQWRVSRVRRLQSLNFSSSR